MSTVRPRLEVLGSLQVCAGEKTHEVPEPGQGLLAYLAVAQRGRPIRRAALAERLWPESSPERASSSLRSALWRLPRPHGCALYTTTATTVALSGELGVDLWEAERQAGVIAHTDDPAVAELRDLSPLTRDLLPEWMDPWLFVEQESYRQKRLHAMERASQILCRVGNFADALTASLVAVQSQPLRESAHCRVIEVHLAEGNQAEALRHYDVYRRLLAAELGLHPSPAIRGLVSPLLGRPADAARP